MSVSLYQVRDFVYDKLSGVRERARGKRIKKDKLDPENCMCSSKCHCLILECGSSAEGLWLVLRSLFFAGKIFRLIFPELNIQACVTVDLNQEHVIFLGYQLPGISSLLKLLNGIQEGMQRKRHRRSLKFILFVCIRITRGNFISKVQRHIIKILSQDTGMNQNYQNLDKSKCINGSNDT